jgi:hypothetical protein
MKNVVFTLAAAGATLSFVAPAQAAILDTFNRADAGTLGPNWTQQAGTSSISNNQATGSNQALATFNGGSGNAVSFDLGSAGAGVQYIAAVLGYGAGNNFFIKVQSNSNSGSFDRYGFYTGNNGGGFFASLSNSFQSAHVDVSYVGTIATLTITPNVGSVQTYTNDYGFTPGGTGIGLGFYGQALADNFADGVIAEAVPEPASWALMIAGFGLAGAAMRRRRKVSVHFA